MANIYDKSSLVLIPSGTKTGKVFSQKPVSGDGDFTFTRASAATRVNADGNIEKETQNRALKSNAFGSGTWNKSNASVTGGQSDKDGGNDAWLLSNTSSGGHISQPQTSDSGQVITISVYAKAGTLNWLRITEYAGTNVWFDLGNGVVATTTSGSNFIASSITDVGNGWYRCTSTTIGGNNSFRFYPSTYYNDESSLGNIYIQDAQRNSGLIAQDYIETDTSAVYGGITDNTPRLDYTDSSCPALLLEPQRTNLFNHSEYFGSTSWVKSNSSVTTNTAVSPSGNTNANLITSSGSEGQIYQTKTLNGSHTFSAFFKAGTSVLARLQFYDSGAGTSGVGIYNLTTKSISASGLSSTGTITDYGNGWYRCTLTASLSGSAVLCFLGLNENAKNILSWGAQLEAGAYATSYIPTYGSSVTRNVDTTYIQNGMTSLNSVDSMTIYFEVDAELLDGSQRYSMLTDLTASNNWIFLSYESNTSIRGYIRGNSNTSWDFSWSSGVPSSGTIKAALVIPADGNAKIYGNGQLRTSYSGAVLVNGFDTIALGGTNGAAGRKQALKQFMVFPTALTEQEAIDLTTI